MKKKIFGTSAAILTVFLIGFWIFVGAKSWPWGKTQEVAASDTTVDTSNGESAKAEEEKGKVSLTDSLKSVDPSDEEKAIQDEYGEDAYPEAKGENESEASVGKAKRTLTKEVFDYYLSMIPKFFCYNTLSADKDGKPTHVITSAKDHGYTNYAISSALSTAFDSAKDDKDGISEELLEEFGNPYFVSVLMRGVANMKYLGVRWREIYGYFDYFIVEDRKAFAKDEKEFWKLMEEDKILDDGYVMSISFDDTPGLTYEEIPGVGGDAIDHWVLPAYEGEEHELTPEYREYASKLAALLYTGDLISYEGVKDRKTVIKSVVDNRVDFGAEDKEGRAGFVRGQFTDDPKRQVKAPMLLFVPRDKNGNITGDFFGIDYWDKNFEIPGSTTKESNGKKINIQDNPTPTPVAKLNNPIPTSTPTSSPKTTPIPTPTPTPTPSPKPTTKKDKSKDPSTKPENAPIAGKNVGEDKDPFQPAGTVPEVWSESVSEAQGGNQSDYTQPIQDGTFTPPGETNPSIPATGETVSVPDDTGNIQTGVAERQTDPNTGADVVDVSIGEDTRIDNGGTQTELPKDVDKSDTKNAGTKNTNTGDENHGYF